MASEQPHIPESMVEGYAMKTLRAPDEEEVEIHLLVCTACQQALETVEQEIQRLRDAMRLFLWEQHRERVRQANLRERWAIA
jgi:hypothetical protein